MILAFIKFYFSRTVKNWRNLRRTCMAASRKAEKETDVEEKP